MYLTLSQYQVLVDVQVSARCTVLYHVSLGLAMAGRGHSEVRSGLKLAGRRSPLGNFSAYSSA